MNVSGRLTDGFDGWITPVGRMVVTMATPYRRGSWAVTRT